MPGNLPPYLQEKLIKLRERYESQSPREKRLISFMGVLLISVIMFYGLYIPALASLKNAQDMYNGQRGLLEWMQINASRLKGATGTLDTAKVQAPLPTLLSDTAKTHDINIQRLELSKDNSARLTIEKASFNHLISWLDALTADNGLNLLSLTVTKTDTPGQVDASVQIGQ